MIHEINGKRYWSGVLVTQKRCGCFDSQYQFYELDKSNKDDMPHRKDKLIESFNHYLKLDKFIEEFTNQ